MGEVQLKSLKRMVAFASSKRSPWSWLAKASLLIAVVALIGVVHAAKEPFRRDPGHPQWHHGSFQDHRSDVRRMTHELLHSPAQVLAL